MTNFVKMKKDFVWSINHKHEHFSEGQIEAISKHFLTQEIAHEMIKSNRAESTSVTSTPVAPAPVKETLVEENKVVEPEENKSVETEAPKKSRRGRKKKSD